MAKRVAPKKTDVEKTRERFLSLQIQANAKAAELEKEGIAEYSRAYNDAFNKMGAYRKDTSVLFDVYDTSRFREVKREVALMERFLNDKSSDVKYVQKMIIEEKYKGAFSGDWFKTYGVSYDLSRIDKDKAKVAFSMYRRLEEDGAFHRKVLDDEAYGSENLIMAIYDMVVQGGLSADDEETIEHWVAYGEVQEKVGRWIDYFYEQRQKEAQEIIDTGNEDTGLLLEILESSNKGIDFITKLNF